MVKPPATHRRPGPRLWHSLGTGALLRLGGFVGALSLLAASAGDWPQWRGPARDGHAAADELLPETLPALLPVRWRIAVGGGFASPVVIGSRVFLADEQSGRETARALDAGTGVELWRTPWADAAGDEWGSGPRCTPLADDGLVFVQSSKGEFACLDQTDGRRLWGFRFERDFGVAYVGGSDQYDAASRRRGHSGSPVVLGDRVYVSVGSTNGATVVCFGKRTGREIWRAGSDETAYAALMVGRLAGRDQVVAYTAFSLLGLDAGKGDVLWRIPLKTHANRHAVTPILQGDSVIVSSHSLGLRSFRITAGDREQGWAAAPGWSDPRLKTSLATMVEVGGHLYGQGPDRNFLCVDAANGQVKWSKPGFGDQAMVAYAATLAAGDRLLVATEKGELVLLRADPSKYVELGRAQACGRTWSHPALAGGRLYLRDRRDLYALELAEPPATPGR